MANQCTFIVNTKPTIKAGQLKFLTIQGAVNSIASVKAILTASHTKSAVTPENTLFNVDFRVIPRANKALGNTTANAPIATDNPLDAASSATAAMTKPHSAWVATTCHADQPGSTSRNACA